MVKNMNRASNPKGAFSTWTFLSNRRVACRLFVVVLWLLAPITTSHAALVNSLMYYSYSETFEFNIYGTVFEDLNHTTLQNGSNVTANISASGGSIDGQEYNDVSGVVATNSNIQFAPGDCTTSGWNTFCGVSYRITFEDTSTGEPTGVNAWSFTIAAYDLAELGLFPGVSTAFVFESGRVMSEWAADDYTPITNADILAWYTDYYDTNHEENYLGYLRGDYEYDADGNLVPIGPESDSSSTFCPNGLLNCDISRRAVGGDTSAASTEEGADVTPTVIGGGYSWSNAFTSYDDALTEIVLDVVLPQGTAPWFAFNFNDLAYGETFDQYGIGSGSSGSVPEPASVFLSMIGVAYLLLRMRTSR